MLQALTERERRILLAILAVLALGAAVKLWRWRVGQRSEAVENPAALVEPGTASMAIAASIAPAFPALTMAVGCGEGGREPGAA